MGESLLGGGAIPQNVSIGGRLLIEAFSLAWCAELTTDICLCILDKSGILYFDTLHVEMFQLRQSSFVRCLLTVCLVCRTLRQVKSAAGNYLFQLLDVVH